MHIHRSLVERQGMCSLQCTWTFCLQKIFPIGTKSHPLSTPPSPLSDTDFKGGVEPIISESYRRKICNLPVVREKGRKAGREGKRLNRQMWKKAPSILGREYFKANLRPEEKKLVGRDEPGKIWWSIGSPQTTLMLTLIFLQRIWVGAEAGWASWMHPRPCMSRSCSWNSFPTAEPTKYNLQEKAVGVVETLLLLFLNWALRKRAHLPKGTNCHRFRDFFSLCRLPDPVPTSMGEHPLEPCGPSQSC